MADKVIVTAAITGAVHLPSMSPYLPITPQQIADECVRSYEAGAAIAHIHTRNPETGQPVSDVNLFRQIASDVKKRCPVIICTTTGGGQGATVEERAKVVPALKPELASFNAGSMNFAPVYAMLGMQLELKFEWERAFIAMNEDAIFPNTFKSMREYAAAFRAQNTKPELEIYDLGQVNNIAVLLERGYVDRPVHVQFVLGITGGAVASGDVLQFLYSQAKASFGQFTWSVCAAGRFQFPLCTQSIMMGGNVRVGMEDNLMLDKGVLAKSNAEQVEKIIRIARELGREPANPSEARQILGLKGLDKVDY